MSDLIHKASHYNYGSIEVIDVIRDWNLNFCLGNTLKYIARADHKGTAIQDLRKAKEYINMEIEYRRQHKTCKWLRKLKAKFRKQKYDAFAVAKDWNIQGWLLSSLVGLSSVESSDNDVAYLRTIKCYLDTEIMIRESATITREQILSRAIGS